MEISEAWYGSATQPGRVWHEKAGKLDKTERQGKANRQERHDKAGRAIHLGRDGNGAWKGKAGPGRNTHGNAGPGWAG
jgi:hypothetical protein